ncbi:ATP-binding protein [Streptacidiphilus fuscans]|uniref:ATP-binding protein n=1 Tax=Streptacidiphilus fuscans TaxID=2789292 RepID=A0A931B8X4_9ACTN|nr:ATP-binding protein [Streptacidiphilus fuscans]MBF9070827.1 ATP-binding protein [Streptacidiphilus fuscans]
MDIWWSLHLRREPASVPLARRILLGTMATAGVDPDVSYEVGVALTEACANAVEHACPGTAAGEDDGFQVTATIEGNRLRIEVTDSGPGFAARMGRHSLGHSQSHGQGLGQGHGRARGSRPRPSAVGSAAVGNAAVGSAAVAISAVPDSSESGRGLLLIRALSDDVQFRNHPRRGAVVRFDKTLTYRDRPFAQAS